MCTLRVYLIGAYSQSFQLAVVGGRGRGTCTHTPAHTHREISKTQCVQSTRVTDKLLGQQSINCDIGSRFSHSRSRSHSQCHSWTPIPCTLLGPLNAAPPPRSPPPFALGTFTSRDNARRAAVRDNGRTYHPPVRTGPALWKC